jgi:S1-C subfamily serine protease
MTSSTGTPTGVLAALSDDLAGAVERAGQSVVAIHARRRIPSSGLVWRPGVVVTASHTVTRDEDITLTLPDARTAPATLAGRDETTDLAVLRTEATGLLPADQAETGALRAGNLVLALGRPGASITASLGVVSAVGGEWRTWQGGRIDRFVRLDLAIYDGFSGGPLVEAGGRVLGINTSGLARGMPLTIPGTTVDHVVDRILAGGRQGRGYLGLASQAVRLPAGLREALHLAGDFGLVVVNVEPGGPADLGGVLLGDILVALDGASVSDPRDVLAVLTPERVGQPIRTRVLRGGQPIELSITIGQRPTGRRR